MLIRSMQSVLILALVNLGSVAKIAVLWRCAAIGVFKRYFWFVAMVALALARSLIGSRHNPHPYTEFWLATQWPTAGLQTAAAIEAFWILAGHFRGIRNFGWLLIGVILAISSAAAGAVSLLRPHWNNPLSGPLLLDQYVGLSLVLTALLSFAFFRQFPRIPIRPNAIRHLTALSVLFGSDFVGYSILPLSHGELKFLTSLVVATGGLVAYSFWAVSMNRAGEALPFPPPMMSDKDYDASEQRHQRSARELRQAASEALRRMFRWKRNATRGWRLWRRQSP